MGREHVGRKVTVRSDGTLVLVRLLDKKLSHAFIFNIFDTFCVQSDVGLRNMRASPMDT